MDNTYIIKYSSIFVKDYVVVEKELNEETLKTELSKIATTGLDCEIVELSFFDNDQTFNNDIFVEILDVTDSDDVKSFRNYLLCFSNKYEDYNYKIQARDKTIYCFNIWNKLKIN